MENYLTGKKILFACISLDGHFNPLTGLAKYLQQTGCEVRWYVSDNYKDKLKDLNIQHYTDTAKLNINSHNMQQLLPDLQTNDKVKKTMIYLDHLFTGRAVGYFKDIQQIHQSFPFDLMICDNMFTASPLVRYQLQVPVMSIGVIPLPEDSKDTAPYKSGLSPAQDDKTRALYADLYKNVLKVYKEPIAAFSNILRKYDVPFTASFFTNILVKSANLHLQIGTPNLEYKRNDLGSNIHYIGALMPYLKPNNKKTWFDKRLNTYEKIVLVTQGTVETDTTKLLEPTLQAFMDTDILVIATTGGNGTEILRKKYTGDNFIITDFVPFEEVMAYASVYITNGGYGGAILSLKHKLPMVTAGVNEGKIEICSRIAYFKLGIDLKTETPAATAIYNATVEILENKIYKENVIRISEEFDTYQPNELCANYAAELLQKYAIQ